MRVTLTIETDNGADIKVERSRVEHQQIAGVEVDLKALDALIAKVGSEARAAFGIEGES